jgi:hypothetical protein
MSHITCVPKAYHSFTIMRRCGRKLCHPTTCMLVSEVDPDYSMAKHYNYIRRQMYVLDTYSDLTDRIQNYVLLLVVCIGKCALAWHDVHSFLLDWIRSWMLICCSSSFPTCVMWMNHVLTHIHAHVSIRLYTCKYMGAHVRLCQLTACICVCAWWYSVAHFLACAHKCAPHITHECAPKIRILHMNAHQRYVYCTWTRTKGHIHVWRTMYR